MSRMQNLYIGAAGQAAAMSEFLIRGYNVAVPEVDRGDDLFVVQDTNGNFSRVQVKTGTGKELKKQGYKTQFLIPFLQLQTPHTPELVYVLVVRYKERWSDYIVIARSDLYSKYTIDNVGSLINGNLLLQLSFRSNQVIIGGQDFQGQRNNFSMWPFIKH